MTTSAALALGFALGALFGNLGLVLWLWRQVNRATPRWGFRASETSQQQFYPPSLKRIRQSLGARVPRWR